MTIMLDLASLSTDAIAVSSICKPYIKRTLGDLATPISITLAPLLRSQSGSFVNEVTKVTEKSIPRMSYKTPGMEFLSSSGVRDCVNSMCTSVQIRVGLVFAVLSYRAMSEERTDSTIGKYNLLASAIYHGKSLRESSLLDTRLCARVLWVHAAVVLRSSSTEPLFRCRQVILQMLQ